MYVFDFGLRRMDRRGLFMDLSIVYYSVFYKFNHVCKLIPVHLHLFVRVVVMVTLYGCDFLDLARTLNN